MSKSKSIKLIYKRNWNEETLRLIREGTPKERSEALTLLCKECYDFVVGQVHAFKSNRGTLSFSDLVQVGMIGLILAARRHRPSKYFFLVEARLGIRAYIMQALRSQSKLIKVTGAGLDAAAAKEAWQNVGNTFTIDDLKATGFDNDGTENIDIFIVQDTLRVLLSGLTAREKYVVLRYIGINRPHMTLAELALKMHLSVSRVFQIYHKSLKKMRAAADQEGITVSDFNLSITPSAISHKTKKVKIGDDKVPYH